MAGDSGFIQLTTSGGPVFVNPAHVIKVERRGRNTVALLDDGSDLYVLEEVRFAASLLGFKSGPVATVSIEVVRDPNH